MSSHYLNPCGPDPSATECLKLQAVCLKRPAGWGADSKGPMATPPRYPHLDVRLQTGHPLAAIAAVRLALRKAAVDPQEIQLFSDLAFAAVGTAARLDICRRWVHLEIRHTPDRA